MIEPVRISGSEDIGKCIGEGKKSLVEHKGLPAKKVFKKWRALYPDLKKWAEDLVLYGEDK